MARAEAVIENVKEVEVTVGQGYLTEIDRLFTTGNDPFDIAEDQINKMVGLSSSFKRKNTREMNKSFTGADDAKSKQKEYATNIGYYKFGVVTPPYNIDYLCKLYEISPVHKAAVDAKVSNVVGLGFNWAESNKMVDILQNLEGSDEKLSKARRKLERAKTELTDWLDSTNAEDTFQETLKKVWTDYESTGNGYLEIGRTTSGKIGYIGHIPSATMRVRSDRDGFVQIVGKEIEFFRHFGDLETGNPITADPRPNEVIHFKKYSPVNTYYGIPDIIGAKNAVAGAEFAARFNLDYFEYKAVPRYVITVKGATLSPTAEARLVEFFQTGLKGKNHRSLYVPLPAGDNVEFKMEPVESKVLDSSFQGYGRDCRDEILMVNRVPLTKVGIPENANLAIARDADKTFKETVVRPEQANLEKKINRIFSEMTDALVMKFNELTLTDEIDQAKIDQIYLQTQVDLPNEVRQRRGLPARKGGDKPFELKPQDAAEKSSQIMDSRARDKERNANATDSVGNARNPKGEGRTVD